MGLRVVVLELMNCGAVDYTVNGHPSLALYGGDDGELLPAAVTPGAPRTVVDPGPTVVTLEPGMRAQSYLSWRNTVRGDPSAAVTATQVSIGASDQAAPQVVPLTVDIGTTGALTVTAWQAAGPS